MSHFTVLVPMKAPTSTFDAIIYSPEEMNEINMLRGTKNPTFEQELRMKSLMEKSSPMEEEIENALSAILAPYNEDNDAPRYLEFVNVEADYRERYETEGVRQIRIPDGSLCFERDPWFQTYYQLYKGKVYLAEKSSDGQLMLPSLAASKHVPSGQPIRGFEVIENYPLKKLFPTFEQFMEKYCDMSFHETENAYGYYHNPQAKWDWWQIGGRWQNAFLVSENCPRLVYGESGVFGPQSESTPAGHLWVAGARKADIQWEPMKDLKLQGLRQSFQTLEQWFFEDIWPSDKPPMLEKTEGGIFDWNDIIYKKGETLEEYIKRMGANPEIRFPCSPFAYIDENGWHGSGDMGWFGISSNQKPAEQWNEEVDAFIASVPDDHYLLWVDCHI